MATRPCTSASETDLPSSDSSLNGSEAWSPSGVTWNAESRSSSGSSAASAGSSASPTRAIASARLRPDVRVARLLELHHAHHAARHRRHALDQVLHLDLLPRHRVLAGVEPEPAGQQGFELAAHVRIHVLGEKGPQGRAVDHQLEGLDVLPADDADVVLDVDEDGLRTLHAGFVQVIEDLVSLRLLREMRRLRDGPGEHQGGHHREASVHDSHTHSPLRPTTLTRARAAILTRPRLRRCAATTSHAGGPSDSVRLAHPGD